MKKSIFLVIFSMLVVIASTYILAYNRGYAAPKDFKEELRSGTWATIRYAVKQQKRVIIIFPDGSTGEGHEHVHNTKRS